MTKLLITLEESGGHDLDSTNKVVTRWETDMDDCSVHAWFKVFASVLAANGFTEETIMSGACQLAFNEWRSQESMKKIAEEYGLVLKEL